jgi:hypothetical protein
MDLLDDLESYSNKQVVKSKKLKRERESVTSNLMSSHYSCQLVDTYIMEENVDAPESAAESQDFAAKCWRIPGVDG